MTERRVETAESTCSFTGEFELRYSSYERLFYHIKDFIRRNVSFPREVHYDIVAAWSIATHALDRFDYVPYLAFVGPPSSGKTRALEVLQLLCKDPILSPTISPASIYRIIEKKQPTLLIDEGGRRSLTSDMVTILNAGQRRGQKALRTVEVRSQNGKDFEVKEFDVFGFKAYAALTDQERTLSSRSLTTYMTKSMASMPRKMDKKRAWRLKVAISEETKTWDAMPDVTQFVDGLNDGRLVELIEPLLQVLPTERERRSLAEYALELESERWKEESVSFQALVFQTFLDVKEGRPFVSIGEVSERLNSTRQSFEKIRSETVGRHLKSLGFRLGKEKGVRGVYSDQNLEAILSGRYPESFSGKPSKLSNRQGEKTDPWTDGRIGRFFRVAEGPHESKELPREAMIPQSPNAKDSNIPLDGWLSI